MGVLCLRSRDQKLACNPVSTLWPFPKEKGNLNRKRLEHAARLREVESIRLMNRIGAGNTTLVFSSTSWKLPAYLSGNWKVTVFPWGQLGSRYFAATTRSYPATDLGLDASPGTCCPSMHGSRLCSLRKPIISLSLPADSSLPRENTTQQSPWLCVPRP